VAEPLRAAGPGAARDAAAGGDFEPRITAFVCNWCTYTGADLAGTSRLHMASNVRIIRLPCTGRIDHMFIVKAFERGADGVIVSGCHPADCHYTAGNYHARRRFGVFRELLSFMGVDPERVTFSWVSASEGAKWKDVVNDTVARVRGLGPFDSYHDLVGPVPADDPFELYEAGGADASSSHAQGDGATGAMDESDGGDGGAA
jgi:F420-non-reducing hydrogenase iron-sulfur subunit